MHSPRHIQEIAGRSAVWSHETPSTRVRAGPCERCVRWPGAEGAAEGGPASYHGAENDENEAPGRTLCCSFPLLRSVREELSWFGRTEIRIRLLRGVAPSVISGNNAWGMARSSWCMPGDLDNHGKYQSPYDRPIHNRPERNPPNTV